MSRHTLLFEGPSTVPWSRVDVRSACASDSAFSNTHTLPVCYGTF